MPDAFAYAAAVACKTDEQTRGDKITIRNSLAALAVLLALPLTALAMDLDREVDFSIPPQSLDAALLQFSQQTRIQVIVSGDIRGQATRGINGHKKINRALTELLEPAGLRYRVASDDVITVAKPDPEKLLFSRANQGLLRLAQAPAPETGEQGGEIDRASEDSPLNRDSNSKDTLEEVVVTARKKSERLLDVPIPLSVISADDLLKSNKARLQDYFAQIPGLSVNPSGVSIRGLSMGALQNPTVASTIDDVSFGATTRGGGFTPMVDPSDIAGVEVLRGPQGSLYGAASLGGLIRYVTADPSTSKFTGRVRVGANASKNGSAAGYNINGSINVPLGDTVALRASALTRRDPGYIDNPIFGIEGLNESRTSGGSLAVLWAPSEAFSLKLSAKYQDTRSDGNQDSQPSLGFGDFKQNQLPGTGMSQPKYQAYSARLRARIGAATLTSTTGYNVSRIRNALDFGTGFQSLIDATEETFGVPNGTTGVAWLNSLRLSKLTEELRLEMPLGARVDWLLGGFYGRERSAGSSRYAAIATDTGQEAGTWGYVFDHAPYTDAAVFTDVTLHVTDRFDLQLGGRQSRIQQSFDEIDIGPFVPVAFFQPSPYVAPSTHDRASAFTYSLTPRLKVTSNLMAYIRMASGYSPGGSNPNADATGVPRSFKPNTTLNYELGLKGEALEQRLSFDVSLYHIIWKDLPLTLVLQHPGGQQNSYTGNAGKAQTQGAELSVQLRPARGLTVGGWVALSDAQLTEPFPPSNGSYGASGDRLPYSMRRSGNFSVDQEFPLGARMTGSIGGTLSYVGARLGNFNFPPPDIPPRQVYGGYATIDLRAGLSAPPWTVDLYANNVADRRALLDGGLASGADMNLTYIAPRSIGLSINRTF